MSLPAFSLFTISKACFPLQENEAYTSLRLLDGEKRTWCAAIKEYVHLEGKWEGATLLPCQIEPNWPLPYNSYQYNGWGMPGRRAGSPVSVLYMREYIAESPKQGSKRFHSIEKTIGFDHLVIIYLCSYSSESDFYINISCHSNKILNFFRFECNFRVCFKFQFSHPI